LRALQEKVCHYKTSNDEIILDVLYLNQDMYILLLFCTIENQWSLMEWVKGEARGRFQIKNLLSSKGRGTGRGSVSLFSFLDSSFGILAVDELFIWQSFRSKPRRVKLRMTSPEDQLFFDSNPVVFVRAMNDGSLILAHRTVFREAYFFSIAQPGLEGYSFCRRVISLNPLDYRRLLYIASVPCITDIVAHGDSIFLHTPGSFRNWNKYPAEGSVLIQMNKEGGVLSSMILERGRGIFSSDGECIMIKPFDNDSILYFNSLRGDRSLHLNLDDHAEWTPGTRETRFCVSHQRIAAWDSRNFMFSIFHNMPDWCLENKSRSVTAC